VQAKGDKAAGVAGHGGALAPVSLRQADGEKEAGPSRHGGAQMSALCLRAAGGGDERMTSLLLHPRPRGRAEATSGAVGG